MRIADVNKSLYLCATKRYLKKNDDEKQFFNYDDRPRMLERTPSAG